MAGDFLTTFFLEAVLLAVWLLPPATKADNRDFNREALLAWISLVLTALSKEL